MSRKREAFFMGIGILAGIALCGPAAQAAANLTATLSSQPIYVDGQQVSMTAYAIGGNNYIKLRDVGEAVGFNVYWDGKAVQIESDRPYTGEAPASHTNPPATRQDTASSAITEESVQASLAKLKAIYPDGTVYPTPYRSASNGPYSRGDHCSGWAALCSDAAFGNLPWRKIDNPTWDQIRPGDLVEYRNSNAYHVVVVVKKTNEYISVSESNTSNKVLWGGQYFKWWLEEQPQYTLYTRYPN